MAHGEFGKWLESVEMTQRTAQRFMQAYEQFGNTTTSSLLNSSKIFEMLSLPRDIDRQQFVEQLHTIPSTGVTKTVDEMTVRELREVKAEYLLIAENVERRGQAEQDPIKKAHIAQFLKEWWGVKKGSAQMRQNGAFKTVDDIAEIIGEDKRTTQRILKLNELIPQLQRLVSSGKLGTTSAEQLAYLTPEVQTALYDALGEEIGERTVAQT